MDKLKKLKNEIRYELKENKATFIVYSILRILVIVVAVLQFRNRNFENVFLCILTLILFIVPSLVQATFKIDIPKTFEITILCFIFSAEILGEINGYYQLFEHWDVILHTLNGFLAASVGFSLVYLLNKNDNLQFSLSPLFVVLVAFSFSMTIGVLWEIGEFSVDVFLGFDSQKDTIIHTINSIELSSDFSIVNINNIHEVMINGEMLPINGYLDIGLYDTMHDLFVNLIGAFVFSIYGFIYLKKEEKNNLVEHFILRRKEIK